MYDNVHSNSVRVNDVNAVKRLLKGYTASFDWKIKKGELTIYAEDNYLGALAIQASSAPDEETNEDAYLDAMYDKGEKGFLELLALLSPYLLSPLQVFESSWQEGTTFVTSFLVLPNDPKVRTFSFSSR